jgi:hypothetical protein
VTSLIRLIWKDQPFFWWVETKNALQFLKASFMTTPFFIHADLSKPFVLEMDISNFTLGVVFSQPRDFFFFHPVGFYFVSFLLPRLIMKFMTKNSWPSWMPLRSDVIYLKEFNVKSLCI